MTIKEIQSKADEIVTKVAGIVRDINSFYDLLHVLDKDAYSKVMAADHAYFDDIEKKKANVRTVKIAVEDKISSLESKLNALKSKYYEELSNGNAEGLNDVRKQINEIQKLLDDAHEELEMANIPDEKLLENPVLYDEYTKAKSAYTANLKDLQKVAKSIYYDKLHSPTKEYDISSASNQLSSFITRRPYFSNAAEDFHNNHSSN